MSTETEARGKSNSAARKAPVKRQPSRPKTNTELEVELRAMARKIGVQDIDEAIDLCAKEAASTPDGTVFDPESFFARYRDNPVFVREMAAAQPMRGAAGYGLTRGGAPLPLDQYGRSGFYVWQERNAGSIRARGLNIEGSSGMGKNEKARLSCRACGQDWELLIAQPLTSVLLTCPAKCNATSANW